MDRFKSAVESTLAWGSPWDESGMGVSVGAVSGVDTLPQRLPIVGDTVVTPACPSTGQVKNHCGPQATRTSQSNPLLGILPHRPRSPTKLAKILPHFRSLLLCQHTALSPREPPSPSVLHDYQISTLTARHLVDRRQVWRTRKRTTPPSRCKSKHW